MAEPITVPNPAPRRWSLRIRVIGAILLVALAPQLLVFIWSQIERNVLGHLWTRARDATEAAAALIARSNGPPHQAELEPIARAHKVRLRLLSEDFATLADIDADDPRAPFSPLERFFLSEPEPAGLRELDEKAGPIGDRVSVKEANQGRTYIACQVPGIVLCEASMRVRGLDGHGRLVYVQTSSARPLDAVDDLRQQLTRIGLVILPLALLLAFYTGRRLVRPIERLRRQALQKATLATPNAALDAGKPDEIGGLADAFNAVVLALENRRRDNEAFVADLVHEFKNPVAAVRACADALSSGTLDEARAARLARVLRDSSGKLDELVTQFLELARAEAGMPNEERTPVDLGALGQGIVERLRDDSRHADAHLDFHGPEGPEAAVVMGVSHRLDALVRELVDNGLSFAGSTGSVQVRVDVAGHDARIIVTDDGPGIAPEDLPHVFTRFFTTRGQRRGTGLGLALVRAVAEAHAGRVSVRSELGRGATFEVSLPLAS